MFSLMIGEEDLSNWEANVDLARLNFGARNLENYKTNRFLSFVERKCIQIKRGKPKLEGDS